MNSAFPSRKMRDCELAHTFCFWKLFPTFAGKMTRGLSLRMVFSLLFQDTPFQAESGAYLRDSSRVPRRRLFMKPPYVIGSVPSLSGHAIAYRCRSLPRVRRHGASKPQGSSERVLLWQVTMDQLICVSLSHTHYWYEVGMLKVPAVSTGVTVTCACAASRLHFSTYRLITANSSSGSSPFSPSTNSIVFCQGLIRAGIEIAFFNAFT